MSPNKLFQKTVDLGFYLLFFITPFILTTTNFELFEFPKMLFVYALTVIIATSWIGSSFTSGKFVIKPSFFLLPLLFFLATQIISTLVSIDVYTSLWGYYSRFHGGLISTICYFLLFLIFISTAKKITVKLSLIALVSSATFISLYAIAEHFGIDAAYWVQDVQNRVYSTLGQPNWLAAWLVAIFPLTLYLYLKPPRTFWSLALFVAQTTTLIAYGLTRIITGEVLPVSFSSLSLFLIFFAGGLYLSYLSAKKIYLVNRQLNSIALLGIISILQLAILFTKSRSGILALFVSFCLFCLLAFLASPNPRKLIKKFIVLAWLFGSLTLIVGTEWTPNIQKMANLLLYHPGAESPSPIANLDQSTTNDQSTSSYQPPPKYHISKSTDIRRAVWEGGLNVYYHYPIFGSGVETFAYSYYNHRIRSHNDTSEWDFLYNKAHNEYLNFLATTGIAGTVAVLAFAFAYFAYSLCHLIKNRSWTLLIFLSPLLLLFHPVLKEKLIIYPPLLQPLILASILALLAVFLLLRFTKPVFPKLTAFQAALVSGFASIIITNYYGFSVVCVALLFFLYPAFASVLHEKTPKKLIVKFASPVDRWENFKWPWLGILGLVLLVAGYLLLAITNYWRADATYISGKQAIESGDVLTGLQQLQFAINLRPNEALYHMEAADALSLVAFTYHSQQASEAAQMAKQYTGLAESEIKKTLTLNQVHLNFYKSATKVYIILAQIDSSFFPKALATLMAAEKLSPTDPKITLNLGLLYQQAGDPDLAQAYFEKTVELKPNYRQAWMTLANFWQEKGEKENAEQAYHYVLEKINPEDEGAQEALKKLSE